ncbi:MAG TPA: MIP/aquaporin family protein [Candidatus Dormibacteraeota bacterium]|nr:MIP/aquaporin family protein [Candidatus Dormibacteraeota bacterium]
MKGPSLPRRVVAETLGTALLLVAVVGSGIAAQRLSPSDTGLELFESAVATGCALAVIILALGPVSGGHLNPVVSLVDAALGGLTRRELVAYVSAQLAGAGIGVVVANLMFALAPVTISGKVRFGLGLWIGEVVATFGLLLVIFGVARSGRSAVVPFAVGAYITGAYFFTSSASFANPAVTVARTLSNTFAGISPGSVAPFIGAELLGGALSYLAIRFLHPDAREIADVVVVPKLPVVEKGGS